MTLTILFICICMLIRKAIDKDNLNKDIDKRVKKEVTAQLKQQQESHYTYTDCVSRMTYDNGQ